jgi:hypothetical protein
MLTEIQSQWIKYLFSTEPSDRLRAEAALGAWYPVILKRPSPEMFFWFDSPDRAWWAVQLLESATERLWQAFVDQKSNRREGRLFIEGLRAELCEKAGMEWDQLTKIAGMHRTQQTMFLGERMTFHGLDDARFKQAWRKDHPHHTEYMTRMHSLSGGPDKESEMCRIEDSFNEVIHEPMHHPCVPGLSFRYCQQSPYTFAKMAEDEEAALSSGREVPPAIAAAWDLARSSGVCWPFEGAVVFLERPAELHFNSEMFLHCDDGPAGTFRDGTKIWARAGKVSSENQILRPESIRPAPVREFVGRVKQRKAGEVQKGPVGKVFTAIAKAFGKRTDVFEKDLPAALPERLGELRAHNHGSLPLLDRYLAGEHEAVWKDLLALGAAVREAPHAADALAVAYETMGRVEANVRTVSERLVQFGFSKSDGPLHTPPNRHVEAQIRELEKVAGTLPLSLRAFYEIVGSVNWIGDHPHFSVARSPLCTDPLVVEPIEAALEYAGAMGEESILIAADALMKANTSGGDPYQIEVPNPAADGVLLFENHDLYFVDYLRLVFRFGGFPGYEGIEHQPPQMAELCAELREF